MQTEALRWCTHSPSTLVQLVDPGDVVAIHLCSFAKPQVWIANGDDGVLAVFGECSAWGEQERSDQDTHTPTHTRIRTLTLSIASQSRSHTKFPGCLSARSQSCAPIL